MHCAMRLYFRSALMLVYQVVVVTERRVVDTFDQQGAPLQTPITLVVKGELPATLAVLQAY